MLLFMLMAMKIPPVDYMDPSRPTPHLSFKERVLFDSAFDNKSLPRLQDVQRMERVLSRFPCLMPLGKWHKRYAFARNASTLLLDKSLVEFVFETPHGNKRAGRHIVPFAGMMTVDDGFFDTAHGVYSTRTHLATLTYCGPNHSDAPKHK